MKKLVLSTALVFALGLSFTSCRDTKETPEEVIENAAEKTEEAVDKAAE